MELSSTFAGHEDALIGLFRAAFSASEGRSEGALIASLVRDLLAGTARDELRVFMALEGERPVGCAIFTRLGHGGGSPLVFLLSPMAVAPDRQGKGIGQALLRHALATLRDNGVGLAVTYGDPAFYGKVGFRPMSEAMVPAPLPLTRPAGWIGKPLKGDSLPRLPGPTTCASALDNPAFW